MLPDRGVDAADGRGPPARCAPCCLCVPPPLPQLAQATACVFSISHTLPEGPLHFCAGGRRQPFYRVLPDPEERPSGETYVAQENIELEPLPALHRNKPGYALHPECGRYFSSLAPGGARYVPCPWLRHCYPDD